jgi:CPA2 family monovalent cation:H+ antiporter-2
MLFPPLLAHSGITPVLGLLAVLLVLLVLLSLALTRLRQSLLIGYFVCGVVTINSSLPEWIGAEGLRERMDNFAESGVVLLMFTLGIEFSLGELRHLRKAALLGGSLQVGLTALFSGVAAYLFGADFSHAITFAVAVALSSTAVSMKTFQDMDIPAAPAARVALGIAIYQDLLVIGFMLLLPILAGAGDQSVHSALLGTLGKAAAFLIVSWLLGRYVIPTVLHSVSRTRSREMFTLTVLALCVSVAALANALGLSPALGAFVAGLVISGSIYSHRVLADILPFKDLFLTLFFVSVGLTIDLKVLTQNWASVLGCTAMLLLVKGGVLALTCRALKMPLRSAALTVTALASTGEFSLVLMAKARDSMGWPETAYQIFVMSTALSMALVPNLMRAAPRVVEWLEKVLNLQARKHLPVDASVSQKTKSLTDHAIICGYGMVGRALHESLVKCGIDCLIVELNVDTVRALKRQGVPVLFADATHRETWELARVVEARLVAFTFPDCDGAVVALAHAREFAPDVMTLARVRFTADRERLEANGVEIVVQDELEAAAAVVRHAETLYEQTAERG